MLAPTVVDIATKTGDSLGLISAAVGVATVAGGFATAVITYLLRRRSTTGRVATSDAEVLWQQSQAMREMLLKEKEMAEQQRDKMIEVNAHMVPVLEKIDAALNTMGATMDAFLKERERA
jgi:hypothetical protein